MLNELLEHLRLRKLSFFWEPDHNMFSEMASNQLTEIYSRMIGIRRELKKINLPTLTAFQKEQIIYNLLCMSNLELNIFRVCF